MPLRAALRSQPTRAFLALRAARLPRRTLVVLGIDTSCDDTSAAVVADDRRILSNVVRSQGAHHEAAGGIVPNVATQRHSAALPGAVSQALSEAGMTVDDVDMVAVTQGPGLAPCVAVGLNAAKTLAAVCKKPLVPVHHMEAHLLTARLCAERGAADVPFPFLCLLASGGESIVKILPLQKAIIQPAFAPAPVILLNATLKLSQGTLCWCWPRGSETTCG